MGARTLVFLMGAALLVQSCATVPVVTKDETVSVAYTVSDGLKVKVTFESVRAYEATQLGLAFFGKNAKDGKVLRVDDTEFFPEYFAMINTDIEDGLLFISDEEADRFSRRIFRVYQKKILPAEMMKDVKTPRIFEDIVIGEPGQKEVPNK